MRPLRRGWRLSQMLVLLFGGLFTVLVVFPMLSPSRRDRTVARWSTWLLRACGIRLKTAGLPLDPVSPGQGRMLVANHISWVDIFVINAIAPSCFIAKDDIARWPLLGTLVGRVGTLFLEQGKRRAVHRAIETVGEYLKQGRRVAVFPEGTTGTGDNLMPFHANLIEAAVTSGMPVEPVALRYRGLKGESVSGDDGPMHFVGDITFLQSVWRILDAPGVWAELHSLPLIPVPTEAGVRARHVIATTARQSIGQCLNLPFDETLPDRVKALRARNGV